MNAYTRFLIVAPIAATFLTLPASRAHRADRIAPNDNRKTAGVMKSGVLAVQLEARAGEWHPDRERDPGLTVHAFGEFGKTLQIPGPLIRVKSGMTVRVSIRNSLGTPNLVVSGLTSPGMGSPGLDTVQIAAGATRELQFVASVPGTYYYSGATTGATDLVRDKIDSQLSGVIVVDDSMAPRTPDDRIFLIGLWRTGAPAGFIGRDELLRFVINGRSWPNTERLQYNNGDSIRFRIVNASTAPHPMHLHGFYFDVKARGNGRVDNAASRSAAPERVVTDRLPAGGTLALTWVPERSGNWLFHCHDNFHILRNRPLDGSTAIEPVAGHTMNHAMDMMAGLVLGIEIRPRRNTPAERVTREARALRLVVRNDSGGTQSEPAYGYDLVDPRRKTATSMPLLPGPTIVLARNEPVAITVVNEIPEPTAVHWHGIELESYYDGVAGFAGRTGHIAPAIAPRDSFVARFTPPRSGTFIYHPHADELRQQQAGLSGAIVVLDSGVTFNPDHDIVLLISVPRLEADVNTVLLNGTNKPALREWRVGQTYRLRFIDIHTARPSMSARLIRDSTLATWRAVAKDGMDLPADRATVRPSQQLMGNGETYDFEFTPAAPGNMRLAISAQTGAVLVTMPIVVRP